MGCTKKNLTRLIVVFAAIEVLILGIGLYYYQKIYSGLTAQVLTNRETLANLSASAMAIKLDQLANMSQKYVADTILAEDVAVGRWSAGAARVQDLLASDASYNDFYVDRFALLDSGGAVQALFPRLAGDPIGQKDESVAEWLPMMADSGTTVYVSNVYMAQAVPHVSEVAVVAPFRNAGTGSAAGFFELRIPTNSFSDFGKDIDMAGDGYAFYVDRVGKIVTHPKYPAGTLVDLSSNAIVQALLRSRAVGSGIFFSNISQTEVVAAYRLLPHYGWGVIARESTAFAFEYRDSVLWRIVWAIVALSFAAAALCYFLIGQPFRKKETKDISTS